MRCCGGGAAEEHPARADPGSAGDRPVGGGGGRWASRWESTRGLRERDREVDEAAMSETP